MRQVNVFIMGEHCLFCDGLEAMLEGYQLLRELARHLEIRGRQCYIERTGGAL